MDAEAYLRKQGWRGSGHSLDHTDRGIKRPLAINKKVDALGVGVQKYAAVTDQWWLRAYDQGLKDLGSGKETTLASAKQHGVNRGGLYARFIKGQAIAGTIEVIEANEGRDNASDQSAVTKNEDQPTDLEVIKLRIQAYVDEAVRLGVIPANKPGKTVVDLSHRPGKADMKAVLKLARLHQRQKAKSDGKGEIDRKKMIRNLKRAAMQHLDSLALGKNG